MSKRLRRIAGFSVLTGVTVLSQSGIASASGLTETPEAPKLPTSASAGIPGDHLDLLMKKYGMSTDKVLDVSKTATPTSKKSAGNAGDVNAFGSIVKTTGATGDVNSFGSIVDVKGGNGNVNAFGSIAHVSAEDCANGNVKAFGSIVTIDPACVGKVEAFGSIVKVKDSGTKETKPDTKDKDKVVEKDKEPKKDKEPVKEKEVEKAPEKEAEKEKPADEVAPVATPAPKAPEPLASVPEVEVQGMELATTGIDGTFPLATLGASLMLLGIAFERTSRRARSNRAATLSL